MYRRPFDGRHLVDILCSITTCTRIHSMIPLCTRKVQQLLGNQSSTSIYLVIFRAVYTPCTPPRRDLGSLSGGAVIRKFHPRKFHPAKIPPTKIPPSENSTHENSTQRKFHPRKFHPAKIPPTKIPPSENSTHENSTQRKFHPAKIRLG